MKNELKINLFEVTNNPKISLHVEAVK